MSVQRNSRGLGRGLASLIPDSALDLDVMPTERGALRVVPIDEVRPNPEQPREIFDKYGADALRWFFFANQPPWTTIRYAERAIKDTIPEFILRLWNCYSFFVNYANSNDKFEPEELVPSRDLTGPGVCLASGGRPGERWYPNRRAVGSIGERWA